MPLSCVIAPKNATFKILFLEAARSGAGCKEDPYCKRITWEIKRELDERKESESEETKGANYEIGKGKRENILVG